MCIIWGLAEDRMAPLRSRIFVFVLRHVVERDSPCLRSWSSRTLKATNLDGSTPWSPNTCTLAREKPHCGVSGVPFMKRTTGAAATALSMAARTSVERRRICEAERMRGEALADVRGRVRAERPRVA